MKIKNILIVSLCLIFILSLCGCGKYDKIRGLWQDKDDGIIMQFYSKDKDSKERKVMVGILNVEYKATYEIDGKKLIITFDDEKSTASENPEEDVKNLFAGETITYFYEIKDDILELTTDNSRLELSRLPLEDETDDSK
jgi:hypothetical protein